MNKVFGWVSCWWCVCTVVCNLCEMMQIWNLTTGRVCVGVFVSLGVAESILFNITDIDERYRMLIQIVFSTYSSVDSTN